MIHHHRCSPSTTPRFLPRIKPRLSADETVYRDIAPQLRSFRDGDIVPTPGLPFAQLLCFTLVGLDRLLKKLSEISLII